MLPTGDAFASSSSGGRQHSSLPSAGAAAGGIASALATAHQLTAAKAEIPKALLPTHAPLEAYRNAVGGKWTSGFVFTCRNDTFLENFQHGVFGLPRGKMKLLEDVDPERTALFLFDSSMRFLHGLYEATCLPGFDLQPAYNASRGSPAAAGRGAEAGSPFPAQVRFRLVHEFEPLEERKMASVVEYNPNSNAFRCKLTALQTRRLIAALDSPADAAPVAKLPWETNGYLQQPTTRPRTQPLAH